MRVDLEQFLALTVALGVVGAVGYAVYNRQEDEDNEQPAASLPSEAGDSAEEPFPEAPPLPDVPAPVTPIPKLDVPDEELDKAPAPQLEAMYR